MLSFHFVVFPSVFSAQVYAGPSEIKHSPSATPVLPSLHLLLNSEHTVFITKVCGELGTTPILLFIPCSLLSPMPDRSLSYTHP